MNTNRLHERVKGYNGNEHKGWVIWQGASKTIRTAMSSDVRTIVVTLEEGVSEEYVSSTLAPAILAMRGIAEVDRELTDANTYFAMVSARAELPKKIMDVLFPEEK